MTTLEDKSLWETTPEEEVLGADILKANTEEIVNRTRLLDNDIKVSTIAYILGLITSFRRLCRVSVRRRRF